MLLLTFAGPAPSQTTSSSMTTMVVESSGSCLNVDNSSSQPGLGIDQWTCTGASNQNFTFTPTSDGYYTIQPQNGGLCLDAGSGSTTTGLQVTQNPCSSTTSQKWRVTASKDAAYVISTPSGVGCLDVYAGRTADGTILTTYACHGSSNESFTMAGFRPALSSGSGAPAKGFVSTLVIQSSGSCVEVNGNSNQAGAGIDQSACKGSSNQSFAFTPTSDGYYNIQPQNSSLCLDAGSASVTTGIQVVQNSCSGAPNQKWQLTVNADTSYAVKTPDGTGCLDVYAGRTADGTIVTTYACHGSSNESFQISQSMPSVTPAPAISPGAGTYTAPFTFTITPVQPGTLVYYTTDGSVPTVLSSLYSGPVSLTTSTTVKTMAVAAGAGASSVISSVYVIQQVQTPAPTISPLAGTYSLPLVVTISPAIVGTPIYYSLDGSIPTTTSRLYSGPIALTASTAVKAIAVAGGAAPSPVITSAFMVQIPQTLAPTISPVAGAYSPPLSVTVSSSVPGASVYYTTDGSTPSAASKGYTGPFPLTSSATVQAVAIASGSTTSPIVSAAFTVQTPQTPAPAISPLAGTYTSPLSVVITPSISGTPIYYTLDGSTPTATSKLYSGPIAFTASATVKAIALAAGATASAFVSTAYTVTNPTPTVPGASITTMVVQSDGSCINVDNNSGQAGLGIDQWTCTGAANQRFVFTPTADGFYTIQPQNNSLCLDAGSGSVTTALQVVQNLCSGGGSQKWKVLANTDASYAVSTSSGGGCLDVYGGRTANGTILTTYACHVAGNESFLLAGFLPAAPTQPASSTGVPVIINSSPSARAGDVIYVQGINFDTTSQVHLGNSAVGSGTQLSVINSVGSTWLAAQIPQSWFGAMFLWVSNSAGNSAAVKLNGAIPFHLDALRLVPGGAFRVLGRNLLMPGYTPLVTVDGKPATINVNASTENMLVATAPGAMSPTSSSIILVDNGNGTGGVKLDRVITVAAGSGDPFNLGVGWGAGFTFAGRLIPVSTPCNGAQDDSGNIQSAINTAASGGGVVQIPAGRCVLANSLTMRSNVVLQGAGKDVTTLLYQANYPISSQGSDLVGLRNFTLTNANGTLEGLIWQQNTRSFIQNVKIAELVSRQLFLTGNQNFVVTQTDFMQTGSVAQQNPYLFSNCSGFLFSNNTSVAIDGSPTFSSIHDALILNNHFSRNSANQNEAVVIATHQFVMDFAYRTSVIGNTFDVINGPITNTNRNDGETLLTEGGGGSRTENLGTVVSATSSTIGDPGNTINVNPFGTGLPENYGVAIVGGTGAGQTREVVGYSGGILQIDHPWDVIPDTTSHYATFVWGLEKSLIQGNTLSGNPRGIWLYQTAVRDVDVSNNTILNGGGIFLRTYQSQAVHQFDAMYNVRVTNNVVTNSDHVWMSYTNSVFVLKDTNDFGTAFTGVEIRGNNLIANNPNVTSATEDYAGTEGFMNVMRSETSGGRLTATPMLLGTIFQSNQCLNCSTAFVIGTGDYGTVLTGNTPASTAPNFLSDWQTLGNGVGASIATVIH